MAEDLVKGDVVDSTYRIERALGRGGMGVVYLAEDIPLQRQVALKFISCRGEEMRDWANERFIIEARAMARVRHPNVVQIHAFGRHDGEPYFVMEYVPGTTLRALIDPSRPIPIDVVLGILRQVGAGIDAVHEQGLVHRDIKPANVLIGPAYRVAIVDFGVVEVMRQKKGLNVSGGSPLYMAPELIGEERIPEDKLHLCDIYSLGTCAFELLTGRTPFVADNLTVLLAMQVSQMPPPPSSVRADLPPGFDLVINRALAKPPRFRWPSCSMFVEQLQAAWDSWDAGRPSEGPRILVVDDDPNILLFYRAALEAAFDDAEVESAEDGLVAFELAKARRPDLIIVDLNMPRVDGMELCRVLAETEGLWTTPRVVISSEVTDERRAALLDMGVAEVHAKPVSPRDLVAIARRRMGD
jgi:serine/threonine protein kinase